MTTVYAPEIKGYELVKYLGGGSFGQVFQAVETASGELVAIKVLIPDKMSLQDRERELRAMHRVGYHPNVIGLRAVAWDQYNCPHAVMELMPKGTLGDLVRQRFATTRTGFREDDVRFLAHQVLRGIEHIHSCGLLHRDIKPDNVLVNERAELKIADLGLAREQKQLYCEDSRGLLPMCRSKFTIEIGTLQYMAPEVLYGNQDAYGAAVDLWSFGCILAELFLGFSLFNRHSDQQMQLEDFLTSKVTGRIVDTEEMKARLTADIPTASAHAIDLICKLLRWDSSKRPSASEALQHPFFPPKQQQQEQQPRLKLQEEQE